MPIKSKQAHFQKEGRRLKLAWSRRSVYLVWALAALAVTLFFRTYPLRNVYLEEAINDRPRAEADVSRYLTDQIKKSLRVQFPDLAEDIQEKLALEKAAGLREDEKDKYTRLVDARLTQRRGSAYLGWSRAYLMEADPYYYFYLTEQIVKTGRMSDRFKDGQYFNPLRPAPDALWANVTWHPYVGYAWYRFVTFLTGPNDLMTALCYFPLFLSAVIVALYFRLGYLMNISAPATFLGTLSFMLAPVVIRRTSFGWYDSDPYNLIFPLLTACLFFMAVDAKRRRALLFGALAGVATGVYSQFWIGWPLLFSLTVLGALTLTVAGRAIKESYFKRAEDFLTGYVPVAIFSATAIMSPALFFKSFEWGWMFLNKFTAESPDLWPNAFLTVGEAKAISIKELMELLGHPLMMALGIFGLAVSGWFCVVKKVWKDTVHWIFMAVWTVVFFVLALKGQRFALFLAFPLSIFVAWGIDRWGFFVESLRTVSKVSIKNIAGKSTAIGLGMAVLFGALEMRTAHAFASRLYPIMNDTWYDALVSLESKTPKDSVVMSWWPPGYFIMALAKRRIMADGGTQHLPEMYWIARALLSTDEREAVGIIRMLLNGGNDALDLLTRAGIKLSDAVNVLNELAPLNKKGAEALLGSRMPPEARQALFSRMYGTESEPPAYILLYDDLMKQNLALSMMTQWNFDRAEADLYKTDLPQKKYASKLDRAFSMLDGFLKYTEEARLVREEGSRLYFSNGLSVDRFTYEAVIAIPQKGLTSPPFSVFYMERGSLKEKIFNGPSRADMSALIIEENGVYSSVLADRRLIASMLFRMYYLNGVGLRYFKPFTAVDGPGRRARIRIYELYWPLNE